MNALTDKDALTLALFMALSAPTDELSEQFVELAEELAATLPEFDVASCKKVALTKWNENEEANRPS